MAKYVFVESRDSFDSLNNEYFPEQVQELSRRGNNTTVFLVQNGVFTARKGSKHKELISKLIQSNVKVLADRFSLRERAIRNLLEGVEVAGMDRLVELVFEPGTKTVWH
jgi:predicted peroxiredoxin